jgi:hypothetical protein
MKRPQGPVRGSTRARKLPKWHGMAQLSRPYQIALVVALAALALFAAVWFVALRHPGGESSSSSVSPSASSAAGSSAAGGSSSPAAPSQVYHGAAPGVEGLTRDIAKAHHAVAESQQNAQQLQSKSAQASGEGTSSAATSSAAAGGTAGAATRSSAKASTATRTAHSGRGSSTGAGTHTHAAARAAALEGELAHGKVAVVLFWNPRASDDRHVREQLQDLSHEDRQLAVQVARSTEVTSFGQFTRTAQVTGTPTVLIVNHRRQATTVTGLTDSFSLQQAIGDAKEGAGRVLAPHFSSWTPTSSRARFIDEANRVCRQATGPTARQLESLGTVKARIAAYVSAVAAIYHRVEGLHVPPRDRAFIHHQFSVVLGVLRHETHPRNGLALRQVFLEGEAAGDELYNALQAYGLPSCV